MRKVCSYRLEWPNDRHQPPRDYGLALGELWFSEHSVTDMLKPSLTIGASLAQTGLPNPVRLTVHSYLPDTSLVVFDHEHNSRPSSWVAVGWNEHVNETYFMPVTRHYVGSSPSKRCLFVTAKPEESK